MLSISKTYTSALEHFLDEKGQCPPKCLLDTVYIIMLRCFEISFFHRPGAFLGFWRGGAGSKAPI